MSSSFSIEALTRDHDREGFRCGVAALERYILQQVTQDMRRGVTSCFVATRNGGGRILGYYTMAMGSLDLGELPPEISRKLPRYPQVPVARVGRLAVDLTIAGDGLGSMLLSNAAARASRSEIAAFAIAVDAKDDAAAAFYRHHGFLPFASARGSLFLPLGDFARRLP